MNTTTQTASLGNVKKVFMMATAAEAVFILLLTAFFAQDRQAEKRSCCNRLTTQSFAAVFFWEFLNNKGEALFLYVSFFQSISFFLIFRFQPNRKE